MTHEHPLPFTADAQKEEVVMHLPDDIPPKWLDRYVASINRLNTIRRYLKQYSEDFAKVRPWVLTCQKKADYKLPRRIGILGRSGTGKTELVRSFVPPKFHALLVAQDGAPQTGVPTEIYLNSSMQEAEVARIHWRTADDIKQLIKIGLLSPYEIALDFPSEEEWNDVFEASIRRLQPTATDTYTANRFVQLRDDLADVVSQYIQLRDTDLPTEVPLNMENGADIELTPLDLAAWTTETSDLNADVASRRIGLIASISYHLRPAPDQLDLGNNVCLVDLPGLSGKGLHDLIVREELSKLDVMLFLVHVKRLAITADLELVRALRETFDFQADEAAADRVFIILNGIDEAAVDQEAFDTTPVEQLISALYEGIALPQNRALPFKISALAANLARAKHRGELPTIQAQKYNSIAHALLSAEEAAAADPGALLNASGIPQLTRSLNKVASKQIYQDIELVENLTLKIIDCLYDAAQSDAGKQTQLHTEGDSIGQQEQQLLFRQRACEQYLMGFRKRQLLGKPDLALKLKAEAAPSICDEIDRLAAKRIRGFWDANVISDMDLRRADHYVLTPTRLILTQLETLVWEGLGIKISSLASKIASHYIQAFRGSDIFAKLIKFGYGHRLAREVFNEDKLAEIQRGIESALIRFAEQLGIVILIEKAKYSFLPLDPPKTKSSTGFQNSESHNAPVQAGMDAHADDLLRILDTLAQKPERTDEDFQAFLGAVRKRYEGAVFESIDKLLFAYEWQMRCAEMNLLSNIGVLFRRLRDERRDDSALMTKIVSEMPDEGKAADVRLQAKIKALLDLKDTSKTVNLA